VQLLRVGQVVGLDLVDDVRRLGLTGTDDVGSSVVAALVENLTQFRTCRYLKAPAS